MPTINRVAFTVFGVEIYWYAVIIVIGMIIGVTTAMAIAKKKGIDIDDLLDIIIFTIPIGIVGARLYYVVTDWDETWSFAQIFNIRQGGLAIYGGVIFGIITALIVCKVKKMSFKDMVKVLDCFAAAVIIGQAIGRWGNFVNMEAYGQLITNENLQFFPFAVLVNGSWYHATFFYESMWNLIGYIILLVINFKHPSWNGVSILTYFIYYGIGRAWIEGLRSDSLYFLKNILGETIRISQVLSVILVIVSIILLVILVKYDRRYPSKGWLRPEIRKRVILEEEEE